MTNILIPMVEDKAVHPPAWLPENAQYLVKTGSVAYGCSLGSSDTDVVGFSIPPKEMVFPHLAGYIDGFGTQKQRFDVWQQHHIEHKGQEYDFSVYSIVRYFHLCLENNPNMVDTLYVPANCVIHCTGLAARVREKRDIFLSKRAWAKFKGYSYSQKSRMVNDKGEAKDKKSEKRQETIDKYGYDTKFAYQLVRLMLEIEQILEEGTLDLNVDGRRQILLDIRQGGWTLQQVMDFFDSKERALQEVYDRSTLRYSPDEGAIKQLLLECLEMHYGSLDKCIHNEDETIRALKAIHELSGKALYRTT